MPYPLPALSVHTIFPCMVIMTCCCSYKIKIYYTYCPGSLVTRGPFAELG